MDKFYYELKVTPNKYYDLYLDLILNLTNDAIEELKGTIILRSEDELQNLKDGIDSFTLGLEKNLNEKLKCEVLLEKKENEDWIQKYKDAIEPITIGKFHIHPSWAKSKEDKINILIDPALAFGSGHHETTSSCLEAISTYVKKGDTLIDVGSGSGILAIGASKLGAICDICDTDPLAIQNAVKNFKSNNTKVNDAWEGSAIITSKTYNVVIANIVADVLIMINKDLKKILNDDGILILSGILTIYKDKVLKRFTQFEILEEIDKNEWTTLVLQKENIDE